MAGKASAVNLDPVKLFDGEIHARVLTNAHYSPEFFAYARAQDMRALIGKGLASSEDVEAFLAEQESLNADGRYFYSVTGFAYVDAPSS